MKISRIIENVYLYFRKTHGVYDSVHLAAEATGISATEVKKVLGFDAYDTRQL